MESDNYSIGGGLDGASEHNIEDDDFDENAAEEQFNVDLQRVREDDARNKLLNGNGELRYIQHITVEEWQKLGNDISNNTHLVYLLLNNGALDDEKVSSLFRGLTSSSSIKHLDLQNNGLSAAGVRSMVPFLQSANDLQALNMSDNILSEGFNILLRALQGSSIQFLSCDSCQIENEDGCDYFPRKLKTLRLSYSNFGTDGCRKIAKLLQAEDCALTHLYLENSKIDDERVAILVDALRNNTSLETLFVRKNNGISTEGKIMLLKLVNDVSSISATLKSNQTLRSLHFTSIRSVGLLNTSEAIQRRIDIATQINVMNGYKKTVDREKVIQTQLHSTTRAVLAELQGVRQSLYSEINPLHLPEVLSLVGRRHGQRELYVALKSSIAGVISTVDRRACCIQEQKKRWKWWWGIWIGVVWCIIGYKFVMAEDLRRNATSY